jgi:ketosteroid isomerase-like protein
VIKGPQKGGQGVSTAADTDELLAANAAFYHAFASGDYTAMDALWATSVPVFCIHPGWPPVHGRDKVMQTWEGILKTPPRPAIRALEEEVMINGTTALVVCFEAIGDIYLAASNFFVREEAGWRLVHHQSGQTERKPKSLLKQASNTLH